MSAGNGKGTILTPQDVLSEHAAKARRLRKPTIGEIEDAMNSFAAQMMEMYGPVAVAMRELKLDMDARLKKLEGLGGDTE